MTKHDTSIHTLPKSGSPRDRGDADVWYGRPPRPHKRLKGMPNQEVTDLTPQETNEYWAGYNQAIADGNWQAAL